MDVNLNLVTKKLKALAHETRVSIVINLSHTDSKCVCNLQEELKISQSSLSQHLKILKEADILDYEKVGGWVHYSLKNPDILKILDYLK